MKKIFMLLSVFTLLFLVGCSKDDNVFKMAKHPTRMYEDDYKRSSIATQFNNGYKPYVEIETSEYKWNTYEIIYSGTVNTGTAFKFVVTKKEIGKYNLSYSVAGSDKGMVLVGQEDDVVRTKMLDILKTEVIK